MSKQKKLVIFFLLSAVAGAFSVYKATQVTTSQHILSQIERNLETVIKRTNIRAAELLERLKAGAGALTAKDKFVVLDQGHLIAWGDHHGIPPVRLLVEDFDTKFIQAGSITGIARKWKVGGDKFLIGFTPLHTEYKISNEYLTPYWNDDVFPVHNLALAEPGSGQGYPIALDGKIIFDILPIPGADSYSKFWSVMAVFFLIGLLLSALRLIWNALKQFRLRSPIASLLTWVGVLVLFRFIMIATEFPARFINSPLFDPKNFASSEWNPSMGDLFLNAATVFFLCLVFSQKEYRLVFFRYTRVNQASQLFFYIVSVAAILFGMLFPWVVIQTIYNNSSISLGITESLRFDELRVFAGLSFLFSAVASFWFMHGFVRLLTQERSLLIRIAGITIGATLFIAINKFSGQIYFWPFSIGMAFIVTIILFRLYRSLHQIQYTALLYISLVVLSIAGVSTFALQHFQNKNNARSQFRFASNFLVDRDNFGEYLLYEATQRIGNDAFIQNRIANPLLGKDVIRDKIKQVSLSGYFNRYEVDITLYNGTGQPLGDPSVPSFSELISTYNQEVFRTEYEGIYWVTTQTGDSFLRRYVALVPIEKNGSTIGYVVLRLALKRFIPTNVFPELLVDRRFQKGYNPDLSYAVAVNGKVQYSAGDFNYDDLVKRALGNVQFYTQGIEFDGYLHVAVEDANSRVAIVSSSLPPSIYAWAEFSFLVLLGFGLIFILLVIQGIRSFTGYRNLMLATRIQLIFNLAFFVPLVAVCISILGLTTQAANEQVRNEYLTKSKDFGNAVSRGMVDRPSNLAEFENTFTNLASLANVDANLYDPDGKLIATSQPLIFENQLLTPYMSSAALRNIKRGDRIFIADDHAGNLSYNVSYTALISPDTGEPSAILAIPFFQSALFLERMQIAALANILSIFTLLFIGLLAISFMVTRWLTWPLQLVTRTIGKVSLTNKNEVLQWNSDDEIGLLIKEYNQMLTKLNLSRQEIERIQRERAWREVAQQVAHEIKNPLTPMKLTLQQLERTLEKDEALAQKWGSPVSALLAQVNSLDDIASSFSTFAKMPEPVMAEVELASLLVGIVNLYKQEGKVELMTISDVRVKGDSQLLGRVFSNLVLNGLQAAHPQRQAHIRIVVEESNLGYRISFHDNGKGVDPAILDKIFLPHFTTKQSGSGLGLAIAKQAIEQMGGRISFQTSATGSTFVVELQKA